MDEMIKYCRSDKSEILVSHAKAKTETKMAECFRLVFVLFTNSQTFIFNLYLDVLFSYTVKSLPAQNFILATEPPPFPGGERLHQSTFCETIYFRACADSVIPLTCQIVIQRRLDTHSEIKVPNHFSPLGCYGPWYTFCISIVYL